MYTSTYLCAVGLPHRDTFAAPVIAEYIREARLSGDARILRFFGDQAAAAKLLSETEELWAALRAREASGRWLHKL
jgi:hypothetical protein